MSHPPLNSKLIQCLSCGAGSASRALLAWGQLYVDRGDQRDIDSGADSGWINFRAEAQPDGAGILTGTFSTRGKTSFTEDFAERLSMAGAGVLSTTLAWFEHQSHEHGGFPVCS